MNAGVFLLATLAHPVAGQVTSRVSVATGGAEANGNSGQNISPSISADGRYVAFTSVASNLVGGDTNGFSDVFVRDRLSDTTERASVDSDGIEPNSYSAYPAISADGRYVAFLSNATNLVRGDTNGLFDTFVHDRQSGVTQRVSVDSSGAQQNGDSGEPAISGDGRYVAFVSAASNLVPGDTNGVHDVFVHDRQTGTTERVSVPTGGGQADGSSFSMYTPNLSISADGRYVAFGSLATNLVSGDTNFARDIFVHDRQSGMTERVSVNSGGTQGNSSSGFYTGPSISADGRYVAFDSVATNLVAADTNSYYDVFVHDRGSGTTERVTVASGGAQGNNDSVYASISADGRYVAFWSNATNLVNGDTNNNADVFVHDRQIGTTERVSVDSNAGQGLGSSLFPSISGDGRYTTFWSTAANLVSADTNGWADVFVRDRDYSPLASLCDPGASGVLACPCSNPPTGLGAGCDNSSETGGAILSASGVATLSKDTLVFTTSGEKPTALSIVMQGNGSIPGGVIYGQGVRCLGGTIIRRLFTKTASGGSITAPELGAFDPSLSLRSAEKGDVIQPGQRRWYLVYYRDPIVSGGCSETHTFNATQTGEVTWWP